MRVMSGLGAVFVCLFVALPARAQVEVPRLEFSAAYRLTPEPSSYNSDGADGVTRHGWTASALVNLNEVFGVDLTGLGSYGENGSTSQDISVHGFLVGPRFTYRENAAVAPYGRALIGAVHRSGSFSDTFLSGQLGGGITFFTSDRLGFVAGGDYTRNARGLQWDEFSLHFGVSFR